MSGALDLVFRYHQETKHRPNAYARGPGRLDWANQPDPFRRYAGSPLIMLDRTGAVDDGVDVDADIVKAGIGERAIRRTPVHLSMKSISRLFFNSLALSAWKSSGGSTWSLRVNPSSGNLHPTEGYMISGVVEGLEGSPGIFHYVPAVHALELRGRLDEKSWNALDLPEGTLLIALSSIHWRESWKYGERAFRYSLTDIGHALAALGIAAFCLGWQVAMLEGADTKDLYRLLGITNADRGEVEHPDCLMAVFSDGEMHDTILPWDELSLLTPEKFQGEPNILSIEHRDWPKIESVAAATIKPAIETTYEKAPFKGALPFAGFCGVIRKRRSAQVMDRRTRMSLDSFCDILRFTLPVSVPFNMLPWKPRVHLALFVHRVEGLDGGLYMLLRDIDHRDAEQREVLMSAMEPDFAWERPAGVPESLDLYLLQQGDARISAKLSSCQQDIASDGCFAAAMIAEFERPLRKIGPWFYHRLHWECGMVGQVLYLGSETMGFRGCGMGCFFDDIVHGMLGLKDMAYQDLYHFAVGKSLEDPRITSLPAYG